MLLLFLFSSPFKFGMLFASTKDLWKEILDYLAYIALIYAEISLKKRCVS